MESILKNEKIDKTIALAVLNIQRRYESLISSMEARYVRQLDKLTNSLENASLRSELDTLSRTSQQDKMRISELEEVNQQLQISVSTQGRRR